MSRIERDGLIYDVIVVGGSTIEVLVPDSNAENQPAAPNSSTAERFYFLESDNASLMLALAESQIKQQETEIKQQQTDQTVSELMLMMAGGQPNV